MARIAETPDLDPRDPDPSDTDAVNVVKQRYIAGEIDEETMERQVGQALTGDLDVSFSEVMQLPSTETITTGYM